VRKAVIGGEDQAFADVHRLRPSLPRLSCAPETCPSLEGALTVIQSECEFNVFISHRSHDKAWVRDELLKRIRQAGLRALIVPRAVGRK
jgi:hypothetical protein